MMRFSTCLLLPPPHTQVVEQFLGSILARSQIEKVGVLIDELGVHGATEKLVIAKHIL